MAAAADPTPQDKQDPTPGKTGDPSGAADPKKDAPGEPHKDTDIQKVIDAIIKRERTDAAAKLTDLQRQLDEAKKATAPKDPPTDDAKGKAKRDDEAYAESIRKPILAELEAAQAKIKARDERTLRTEIKTVAAELSVDADEVAAQLLSRVRLGEADAVEVVDAEGRIEYGKKGPKTVTELVTELLTRKPYLAKATVRSGIGVQNVNAKTGSVADEIAAVKGEIAAAEKDKKWGLAGQLKIKLTELQSKK
ncbi:MAG TPA: hypothetical protein VFW98_08370 [Gemmatimonadaceae bacterium]|nr:hypothetical protein [Gemmatimonadaceae bacterium]